MNPGRRLKICLWLLLLVITGGVLGYHLLEKLSFLDALYMTVITVSTVGFKEVIEFSPVGRLFTIFLILFGVGTAFLVFTNITQWVVEGELRQLLGRRSLERRIERLQDHYILCGLGRVGRLIAKEFGKERAPFVVIEKDREVLARHQWEGLLFVQGDATQEENLMRQ